MGKPLYVSEGFENLEAYMALLALKPELKQSDLRE